MGVNRFVLLEPNVVKLHMELPPPSLEDHRSHLSRVMDEVEAQGYTRNYDWDVLPRVAEAFAGRSRRSPPRSSASTSSTARRGTPRPGCSAPRSTSGPPRACARSSTCATARRSPWRADQPPGLVRRRRDGSRRQSDAGPRAHRAAAGGGARDRERAVRPRPGGGRGPPGRSTSRSWSATPRCCLLLCGVSPESIAVAPYVATFLEAQHFRADQIGFSIHPHGWVALYPSIGAYVGADIVADIVATGLVASRRPGCSSTSAPTARSLRQR